MKIDIHAHTKRVKSGEADTRNIDVDRFERIIRSTEVKILAITNHNHFDNSQYIQFSERLDKICQIWPGVELDILEDGKRAHLIVIVNPKYHIKLDDRLTSLNRNSTPENLSLTIKETVEIFDDLAPIYIPHYFVKKPNLDDEGIELLMNLVQNNRHVIKEATNSISAGIYISHGYDSIYGSDIHDWDRYIEISMDLPDLRLPVESFEQFCLLLEKDDNTIQTVLDKKSKELVQITPFTLAEQITLEIYNDINIIFGSKGTGKTEILKALSKYYNEKGYKTSVYESSSTHLNEVYNVKGSDLGIDLQEFDIEDCSEEFQIVKESVEKEITSIKKYFQYYSSVATNRISQKIAIKNFERLDDSQLRRRFEEIKDLLLQFRKFNNAIIEDNILKETVGKELVEELIDVVGRILNKVKTESEKRFFDSKSISMFNSIIKVFVSEISRKTGQPEKPVKTGFQDYASNRIKIERTIRKILLNIDKKIEPIIEYVGDLGEKGNLECQTNIHIQNGSLTDVKLATISNVKKTPQKEVAKSFRAISKYIYSNELFEKITELKLVDGGETIESIYDLLLFNRHFIVDGQRYNPSNGESSMILLHNELKQDKEIYLIDEPEKSLGNDYINDVIVPLLKERAQQGKKVIVATHDANIAVRTLPYSSTYRQHDLNNYYTFIGNPFTNNLVCITGEKPSLDWKNISMKTLEGGRDAFGERSKIYGNI